MTGTAPTAPAKTPGFFSSIIAWGKEELQTIEGHAVTLWDTIEPALVAEAESWSRSFSALPSRR